ncbi:hypothetical protein PCASD_05426 [Puccinia coronata f. sp. avenae]|uniref:Uncharacterized protein n=1 Tax=Puccinia coronata f. sp. avenae TaxID=200324 RepID=A0A2N5UV41_9BASI|nr:hypothetical protein PCASD_05426 [Puccinia coronata f. sp. avenae]
MSCHHFPYQRSQSGTQHKVVGRAGGALQRELQCAELGSPFEVKFDAQSPEATLSDTQASTLEQLMRGITGNKSLVLDKEKKRLYPIVTLDNPSHDASMTMFLRQPTMYTETLHIAGCRQSAVDAATLELSSITGSPGGVPHAVPLRLGVMCQGSKVMATELMTDNRPFLYDGKLFWRAYDAYVYAYDIYSDEARRGVIMDHHTVGLALKDAVYARLCRIRSMRLAIRQDDDIDTCDHLSPDLSSCENTEARAMLTEHWNKYAGTVACICKNATRYFYDL